MKAVGKEPYARGCHERICTRCGFIGIPAYLPLSVLLRVVWYVNGAAAALAAVAVVGSTTWLAPSGFQQTFGFTTLVALLVIAGWWFIGAVIGAIGFHLPAICRKCEEPRPIPLDSPQGERLVPRVTAADLQEVNPPQRLRAVSGGD